MAFKILIVEDAAELRSFIDEKLPSRLDTPKKRRVRTASSPSFKTDYAVSAVDSDDLDELTRPRRPSRWIAALDGVFRRHGEPDLLILDLALTHAQAEAMGKGGAMDKTGQRDPQKALEQTTGFRILKHLVAQPPAKAPIPVVTTLSANPKVTTACLAAGAFAVVVKPEPNEKMKFFYDLGAGRKTLRSDATYEQMRKARHLLPLIDRYLAQLASETRKGAREAMLRRTEGHAPVPVTLWAAHNRSDLEAKALRDTNLLLMDVRGFSRLVALGVNKPEAVFDLMNIIWEHVLGVLTKHGAEVNNFIGDAALVFRGVYSYDGSDSLLPGTLQCARELCTAFRLKGPIRQALKRRIQEKYQSILSGKAETRAMLSHIAKPTFGLRIVIAVPDEKEGLYGKVGIDRRWQHTILSRFMNALARAESAVGKWEKEEKIELAPAHCFLLWDSQRPRPPVLGVTFEKAKEFLGSNYPPIRDVPRPLVILRVRW